MNEHEQPKPRKRRGWLRVSVVIVVCVAIVSAAAKFWFRDRFPYGVTHACSKSLGLGLRLHANDHQGWLPSGGQTSEESLSYACTNKDEYGLKGLMGGKNIKQSVVEEAFARHGVLSPTSCGWHYVEGLREDDPPTVAVAWDKAVGLTHNGQYGRNIQCEAVMLDGSSQLISKGAWSNFYTTQKSLIAQIVADRMSNDPPIRWSDEAALGPNKFPPPAISKSK